MFKTNDVLVNKKNPTLVVLILDESGKAVILESTKFKKGESFTCTSSKLYEQHENPDKYLKDKITLKYKKDKSIKILEYL